MRKLVLLVSTLAVACGGGGGGSGGGAALTGSVGGRAFTPVEVKAIPAGTGTDGCTVTVGDQTANVGVKAVALQVTSYADACGDFATSECRRHMGAQSVTILVGKLDLLGAEPALTTGTYTLRPSITAMELESGTTYKLGYAEALGTNSSCGGSASPVTTGTVRLDRVGDPVTGHVSITFADGSRLEGDFSAPACAGLSPDICQKATAEALCTPSSSCM